MVAFPASLSSAMAGSEWTPPVGTPYKHEAMRAVDYMVESAGGADKVKAALSMTKPITVKMALRASRRLRQQLASPLLSKR